MGKLVKNSCAKHGCNIDDKVLQQKNHQKETRQGHSNFSKYGR